MHFHGDCGPEPKSTSCPWIKDKLTDAGEGQAMLRVMAMLRVVPWIPDPVCCPHSHSILLYLAAVTMQFT